MAAALDNANPTILSASQLPTRQQRIQPRKGPDSKYSDVIFSKPSYLSRPFCDADPLWPVSDSSDDDFSSEAIDEQEIYGTSVIASQIQTRLGFSHAPFWHRTREFQNTAQYRAHTSQTSSRQSRTPNIPSH